MREDGCKIVPHELLLPHELRVGHHVLQVQVKRRCSVLPEAGRADVTQLNTALHPNATRPESTKPHGTL